jgi:hypothetical protein
MAGKDRRTPEAAPFPGKERILQELASGPTRRRVGFEISGAPAREGCAVYDSTGATKLGTSLFFRHTKHTDDPWDRGYHFWHTITNAGEEHRHGIYSKWLA